MAASNTKKNTTTQKKVSNNNIPRPSRVKRWTKELLKKRIMEWNKYIADENLPRTLQSFFLFIPKRTIHNWKNNVDQQDLWDIYTDQVHVVVENYQLNQMMQSKQPTPHIFYLKSAFKYSDKPEQTGDQYMIQLNLDNNGPNKLKPTKEKKND